MEERVPPATYTREDLDTAPLPSRPPPPSNVYWSYGGHDDTFGSGTYVVQIPKDQIYRVPPPENAAYVERHRSKPTQQKRSIGSRLLYPLLFLVLLAVIIVVIVAISHSALNPKDVKFSVDHQIVVNHHPKPNYVVTLKAENPNKRLDVRYLEGGDASLSFMHHKISTGHTPAFSTEAKASTKVRLVLSGLKNKLPSEVQTSLKGKGKSITLSLSVNIPVKTAIGILNSRSSMHMAVTCDLRVNTLAKGTQVLSQKCHTKV